MDADLATAEMSGGDVLAIKEPWGRLFPVESLIAFCLTLENPMPANANRRSFKRVVLKLSGEALRGTGGQDNISPPIVERMAAEIKEAHQSGDRDRPCRGWWQFLAWYFGGEQRHGTVDGGLHGHASHRDELIGLAEYVRGDGRAHARADGY